MFAHVPNLPKICFNQETFWVPDPGLRLFRKKIDRRATTLRCEWGRRDLKTRVATLSDDNNVLGGTYRQFFESWFSDVNATRQRKRCASMWRRHRNVHVLLHVLADGESPVSSAMTHMRWAKGKVGTRTRITHRVWSTVSVGGKPGPSICARTTTRAELRPFVNTDRHRDTGVSCLWTS